MMKPTCPQTRLVRPVVRPVVRPSSTMLVPVHRGGVEVEGSAPHGGGDHQVPRQARPTPMLSGVEVSVFHKGVKECGKEERWKRGGGEVEERWGRGGGEVEERWRRGSRPSSKIREQKLQYGIL